MFHSPGDARQPSHILISKRTDAPSMHRGLPAARSAANTSHLSAHFFRHCPGDFAMTFHRGATTRLLPMIALVFAALSASAQSGSAGAVHGTVTDPSGAVI